MSPLNRAAVELLFWGLTFVFLASVGFVGPWTAVFLVYVGYMAVRYTRRRRDDRVDS